MTIKDKSSIKKKKAPGKPTSKAVTKTTRRKRNKNNLTEHEQAFADIILRNDHGMSDIDIVLSIRPHIKRSTANVVASNWRKDERVVAYMEKMRQKVEEQVEYDLVQWRKDVLELIDIGMGRKPREQIVTITNEEGQRVQVQLDPVKQFEGNVAKGALELIGKQMKLLTDKVELGGNKDQPLHWVVDVVESSKDSDA